MTKPPKLSIAIPTYNRRPFLQQTLDVLLPQLTDDIEVVILDNCSTDDTQEFVGSLDGRVRYFRQEANLGPDRNMISCLQRSQGRYVWTLCDDDLVCRNAVEKLLSAMTDHGDPAMLYLRATTADSTVSNYDDRAVDTGWTEVDGDGFLDNISIWFTFASSIVVRRDCIDDEFVSGRIGTNLVPAALTLSTAGKYNQVVISDKPLLYARGDNTGGYNGLTVFTRNIIRLFRACDRRWFSKRVMRKTYNDNLASIVHMIVQRWKLNAAGLFNLVLYSCGYRCFYTRVAPALVKRSWNRLRRPSIV